MTLNGWFQILFFSAAVLLVTKPAGIFMARVFSGERTFLDPVLRPVERLIYRLTRVDETARNALDGIFGVRCCCSAVSPCWCCT